MKRKIIEYIKQSPDSKFGLAILECGHKFTVTFHEWQTGEIHCTECFIERENKL